MKKSFILSMAVALLPLVGHASELMPESCTIGNRPMVYPLEEVGFNFDGAVELSNIAYAVVRCGNEIVATADHFDVSNYVGTKRTQGTLIIFFETQCLPTGHDYTLEVCAGSVHSKEDKTRYNPQLEIPFTVPADLGEHRTDITPGLVIERSRHIWVYWSTETEAAGSPEWTLYRNDEVEGTYPAHVGWDWDLGQAYVDFGENKTFDRDVRYTLVLPAGSVRSRYRDDLINREVRIEFVGGYDIPGPDPLVYTWCSLFNEHPQDGRIGMVRFTYPRPIIVSEGAKVLLYEVSPELFVAEADAYLDTSVNCFQLCCDFGGFQMKPSTGYTFVIPEGTVSAADESGIVNPRQTYTISQSAVETVIEDKYPEESATFDVTGRRVTETMPGSIYIRNGKKFVAGD